MKKEKLEHLLKVFALESVAIQEAKDALDQKYEQLNEEKVSISTFHKYLNRE